jgi:hypothetical protein
MRNTILILAACLALAGCDTFVRKEVVVEYKYVVRKATDQQKNKPEYPPAIDVSKANQLQLAEWIKQNEERGLRLESLIDTLISFYEKEPSVEEKTAAQKPGK